MLMIKIIVRSKKGFHVSLKDASSARMFAELASFAFGLDSGKIAVCLAIRILVSFGNTLLTALDVFVIVFRNMIQLRMIIS